MDQIIIDAEPREPGKSSVRAVRKSEKVPCVLYGSDLETQVFKVPELSLRPLIYTNEFHRVSIQFEGKKYPCILKTVDFDPVSDRPIHADFQALVEGELLTLNVPLHFIGTAIGITDGGTPQEFAHEISVRCTPANIPDHIEIDITHLEIGDSLLVRDLRVENIVINHPEDQALISIIQPREEIVELELDVLEGEEGEEGEEGAEGEASAEGDDDGDEKKSTDD